MKILKTVLSAGLGLGLSLTGVEVLAAEEAKKYRPNISFSGFYGQNDNGYGSLDILYPVHQKNDGLMFVDLRGLLKKSPVKEFNVGGGYRWLSSDKQKLYGAYGFFDRKMTENNNWFNQVTIGGELKTENGLSLGGNVYLPVGTKSYEVGREVVEERNVGGAPVLRPYKSNKFTINFMTEIDTMIETEYALTGVDLEVGHAIPLVSGLKGYIGGYYFSHSKVEKVMGPRATLVYDLAPLMPKQLRLIDHLELETSIQHDEPRGSIWYAGVRLQIQLGSSKGKSKLKGLEKQLTAFVRRDLDVVDQSGKEFETNIRETPWTKDNGQPYVGQIVTTEAELTALTQGLDKDEGEVDIIGVKGIIPVTGVTYTNNTTAAAIRLNYGQSITGQDFTFIANDGKTYTVNIVNSDQDIVGADPSSDRGGLTLQGNNGAVGNLLQVYTSDTMSAEQLSARVQRIEDLVLTVPENSTGDTALGVSSAAITNLRGRIGASSGEGFGHVVIEHIDANSSVYFEGNPAIAGQDKLTVKGSRFNLTAMKEYAGMVHAYSTDVESITNNHLVNLSAVDGKKISAIYVSHFNSGLIADNQFDGIFATGSNATAYGIEIRGSLGAGAVIRDNDFASITSADATAGGIYVVESIYQGAVVRDNTFKINALASSQKAIGIEQFENGIYTVNLNAVTGNVFTLYNGTSGNSYGLSYKANTQVGLTEFATRNQQIEGTLSAIVDAS